MTRKYEPTVPELGASQLEKIEDELRNRSFASQPAPGQLTLPEAVEPVAETPVEDLSVLTYPFTEADSNRAHDEWGANCGPNALAFALGVHIDKVRGTIPGFEEKHYTNPTMMKAALATAGVGFTSVRVPAVKPGHLADAEPMFHERIALVRIQWDGPWTEPGANARWGYRFSHWIATWLHRGGDSDFVFDVNGGVRRFESWDKEIVPLLTAEIPRADGHWRPTHIWRLAK